jgi:hypothetical protein
MTSNPSMALIYTHGGANEKLNVDVQDPVRKNAFTSSEYWNLLDKTTYNNLKWNAKFGRYHPVYNWWDAGELNQMPPQHYMKPLVQFSGGPEDGIQ